MKTHALILGGLVAVASTVTAGEAVDLSKIDISKLPPAATKKGLTYSTDIKPLLEASCTRCHGQDRPKAGLQLTSLDTLLKGGKDGKVVVPGDSKKTLLVIAAAQIDEETAMPPKRGPGRGGPGGPGGGRPPGGPQGGGGPGGGPGGPGGPGGFGPPPKPLTAEQVGIVRAWVDQGSK
jgi:hypothetical protein